MDIWNQGEIIAPIARLDEIPLIPDEWQGGKYAHTSYKIVASYGNIHLVYIHTCTGLEPQIRVHFSHIGFPLLGDDLYGGSLEDGIQRQCLCIDYLSFYHPFLEQDLQLESPLPDDFSNIITQLSTNILYKLCLRVYIIF